MLDLPNLLRKRIMYRMIHSPPSRILRLKKRRQRKGTWKLRVAATTSTTGQPKHHGAPEKADGNPKAASEIGMEIAPSHQQGIHGSENV